MAKEGLGITAIAAMMLGFAVYYTVGSSYVSFWQLYCKIVTYASLLLFSILFYSFARSKWGFVFSYAGIVYFSSVTAFYIISTLLFNFFEIAINQYVGYVFIANMLISLTLSLKAYGNKRGKL